MRLKKTTRKRTGDGTFQPGFQKCALAAAPMCGRGVVFSVSAVCNLLLLKSGGGRKGGERPQLCETPGQTTLSLPVPSAPAHGAGGSATTPRLAHPSISGLHRSALNEVRPVEVNTLEGDRKKKKKARKKSGSS